MSLAKGLASILPEEENVSVQDSQTSGDLPTERKITINSTSYDIFPTDEELAEFFRKAKENENKLLDIAVGEFSFGLRYSWNYFSCIILYSERNVYYGSIYIDWEHQSMDSSKEEKFRKFIEYFRMKIDSALYSAIKAIPEFRQQLIDLRVNQINEDLDSVKTSFVKIGLVLRGMKQDNLYDTKKDFYDYVEELFGFKKSTTKNMISLCENFCLSEYDRTKYITVYHEELQDEYKGYSYSQLVEMLPLTSEERKKVKPEMTVVQIREIKQNLKEKSVSGIIGQTSGQTMNSSFRELPEKKETETFEPETIKTEVPSAGLKFKNDEEREKFLKDYKKNFYLWLDVPALGFKVYRYDLINKVSILFFEGHCNEYHSYMLLDNGRKNKTDCFVRENFTFSLDTRGQVVNWLKSYRAEI